MIIRNKKDMFELYMQGKFGNMFPTWYYPDFIKLYRYELYDKLLCLRYKNKPGTQWPNYAIPLFVDELLYTAKEWINLGADPKDIVVNINKELTRVYQPIRTMQGEVMECDIVPGIEPHSLRVGHYSLLYSHLNENMRPALEKDSKNVSGATADFLLSRYMDPPSRDNLRRLLYEDYPGSVVEFTCYDRSIGTLGWNTIFWEVRHY
jgi:hypothetical protein